MQDEMEKRIKEKAIEFHSEIMNQHVIAVGGVAYHYDDFIADFEFDNYNLFELQKYGATKTLRNNMNEALVNYCEDLAKEAIELEQIK